MYIKSKRKKSEMSIDKYKSGWTKNIREYQITAKF